MLAWLEHVVFAVVVLVLFKTWTRRGFEGVIAVVSQVLLSLPGFRTLVRWFLAKEVTNFTKQIRAKEDQQSKEQRRPATVLPKKGSLWEAPVGLYNWSWARSKIGYGTGCSVGPTHVIPLMLSAVCLSISKWLKRTCAWNRGYDE